MGSSLLRRVLVVSVILVVPVVGARAGSRPDRHRDRCHGRVLPGVTIKAVHDGVGQHLRSRDRSARGLPHSRARRRLQDHGEARRASAPSPATAWSCWSGRRAPSTFRWRPAAWQEIVTVTGAGAAHRNHDLEPRRQHRSAAGVGAAVAGPQLDVARAAGAGQPHQRAGRHAGAGPRRRPRVPAQRRRPAGDGEPRHRQPGRGTATTRSRSSSSSRTGSTRRRADRRACR